MTPQAAIPQQSSAEEKLKRLRLRKVYIQLRIPRVKAEIAAVAARKKAINESGGDLTKEVLEERIYSNQHLVALRNEAESLEQERKTVLQDLRQLKLQDQETPLRMAPG